LFPLILLQAKAVREIFLMLSFSLVEVSINSPSGEGGEYYFSFFRLFGAPER
jgi:hypothetical protein